MVKIALPKEILDTFVTLSTIILHVLNLNTYNSFKF